MNNPSTDALKSLLQTLNDGISFYDTALRKIEHENFRPVLEELAQCHEMAKSYLQPYLVLQTGATEEGHTFGGKLHQKFVEIEENSNLDHDFTLLKQLEMVETVTIDMMELTAELSESSLVKTIIKELLPRMHACKDKVRHLEDMSRVACAS